MDDNYFHDLCRVVQIGNMVKNHPDPNRTLDLNALLEELGAMKARLLAEVHAHEAREERLVHGTTKLKIVK